MNKISATLAGLALVAGASMAPAFAGGGVFSTSTITPPAGTFTTSTTGYDFLTSDATYSFGTGSVVGTLSLVGTEIGTGPYYNTVLDFTTGPTGVIKESGITSLLAGPDIFAPISATNFKIADASTFTFGDRVTVGPFAPVPEASSVVSFGALLALGGLAFLRRKTVQSAA